MKKITADILVIGGGVIGINMAIQAKRRHPDSNILLIEKESDLGIHASGRNSGVLHAGFYYTADSLKAKFTRDGNRALTEYCVDKGLNINRCGKLVVAKNESELTTLNTLLERGIKNGVEIYEISEKEAREIEPRIKTFQKALSSPTTSSVDPKEVMASLISDARSLGVQIMPETRYIKRTSKGIETNMGIIEAAYIINAAGLYADKIARDYGFCEDYTIIPFKGLYLISNEPKGAVKTNIYPVPDLNNPFLGVHFTIAVSGKIKLGPTAIPAFWREHYKGLDNFNMREFIEISSREMTFFLRNDFGFRGLAFNEIWKYMRSHMVKLASELATGVNVENYKLRGPAGIRAQLYNIKQRKLEMDFNYEGDDKTFHILNAVSPAFTCSMPFTEYLFDKIESLIKS